MSENFRKQVENLFFTQGRSMAEIAETLGVSMTVVDEIVCGSIAFDTPSGDE